MFQKHAFFSPARKSMLCFRLRSPPEGGTVPAQPSKGFLNIYPLFLQLYFCFEHKKGNSETFFK